MQKSPPQLLLYAGLLLMLLLSACAPAWETTLVDAQGNAISINRKSLQALEPFAAEDGAARVLSVPLERLFYQHGYRLIETLEVLTPEGQTLTYDWAPIAETAALTEKGQLQWGEVTLKAEQVRALPPVLPAAPTTSLLDVAPTVAAVLGVAAPADAAGKPLPLVGAGNVAPQQIALIFLDGFGYLRYSEALTEGLIPNLAALPEPALGIASYQPCTVVGSAAILTGAPPEVTGITTRGIRSTETETIFDVVIAAGLRGVAIEGEALAFNMRNAELTLSGDRDGNGGSDDNVLSNVLAVLETGMPDLLWVHFHGIDDAGHTYGPGATEERAKITEVDAAVGEVLATLPPHTAVLIFADHGMHAVAEEGRLGNHGQLIVRDMLIPIWAFVTQ